MMRLLVAAFALLLCGTVGAEAAGVTRIEIVEYGIYTSAGQPPARTQSGVLRSTVGNVRLVSATRSVPLRHGVEFGIRYKVVGDPNGEIVPLDEVTIFPAALRPPGSRAPVHSDTLRVKAVIGATRYDGYQFEEPFESVPGRWTLEVWYKGRKLASQSFIVK